MSDAPAWCQVCHERLQPNHELLVDPCHKCNAARSERGIDEKTRANIRELVSIMENEKNSSASPTTWGFVLYANDFSTPPIASTVITRNTVPPYCLKSKGQGFRLKELENPGHGHGTARYILGPIGADEAYEDWSEITGNPKKEETDWLLLLPASSQFDNTLDKGKRITSCNPPMFIKKGQKTFKLKSSDGKNGTAIYQYGGIEPGKAFYDWEELSQSEVGWKDVGIVPKSDPEEEVSNLHHNEQIAQWQAEFGEVIDNDLAMDSRGITSVLVQAAERPLRARWDALNPETPTEPTTLQSWIVTLYHSEEMDLAADCGYVAELHQPPRAISHTGRNFLLKNVRYNGPDAYDEAEYVLGNLKNARGVEWSRMKMSNLDVWAGEPVSSITDSFRRLKHFARLLGSQTGDDGDFGILHRIQEREKEWLREQNRINNPIPVVDESEEAFRRFVGHHAVRNVEVERLRSAFEAGIEYGNGESND